MMHGVLYPYIYMSNVMFSCVVFRMAASCLQRSSRISDLLLSVTRIHPVVEHKSNRESLLLGVKVQRFTWWRSEGTGDTLKSKQMTLKNAT